MRAETVTQFGSNEEDEKKQNVCMDGTPEDLHQRASPGFGHNGLHLIRFWKEYGIAIPSLAERSEALPCIGREHPCLSKEADKEFITLSVR